MEDSNRKGGLDPFQANLDAARLGEIHRDQRQRIAAILPASRGATCALKSPDLTRSSHLRARCAVRLSGLHLLKQRAYAE